MRALVAVLVCSVLMSGSASAQSTCKSGADFLNVEEWSIEPIDSQYNSLSVTLRNTGAKDVRMVDGSVGFIDALGGNIASYTIDRDAELPAGELYSQTGRWGPHTFERLLKLRPEEVTAWACVRSAVYDDGTVEKFE